MKSQEALKYLHSRFIEDEHFCVANAKQAEEVIKHDLAVLEILKTLNLKLVLNTSIGSRVKDLRPIGYKLECESLLTPEQCQLVAEWIEN